VQSKNNGVRNMKGVDDTMKLLSLTEVSGPSAKQVADSVSETVSENMADVQEQTNIVINYITSHIPNMITFAINVVIAVVIFFVGKKIINILRRIVKKSLTKTNADVGVVQFLDSVVKGILYFILIVIIVGRFGVHASSLMAIVGSAGLALGLALQGSLSNFAGGVLILLLKPFKVGDYIIASEEGTVQQIQIFYTKLVTVDNKLIYLPNGALANSNITNVTAEAIRRVDMNVGIAYSADLKLAKQILTQIAETYPKRIEDKEISVFVNELGASEVNLGLRIWVKTDDYWDAKWAITEEVKLSFDENGIEIPFNQLDVHINQ